MSKIDSKILDAFQPVSLEEMGKVRLMNRVDTKFVTDLERIVRLLDLASGNYLIQQIDGRRNMPYYTRYYDTPDADMFYQHQRGKKTRQKIRVRRYEESLTEPFVEIKSKNNKGRTGKIRVAMDGGESLDMYEEFIDSNSNYQTQNLIPQIENHFYRITLVDKQMTERITIDTGLEFHNLNTGRRISLDNIGIIEWKRDGRNCRSGFDRLLRTLRIHSSGFSKYCIGMAATNSSLRQNRLKKKMRMIESISPYISKSIT